MLSVKCNIDELPLSLTVMDVARILGLSKTNAYCLCNSKGFPCIRAGRRMIIPKTAFAKWMENPSK